MKFIWVLVFSFYASTSFARVHCENWGDGKPNTRRVTVSPKGDGRFEMRDELINRRDGSHFWDFKKDIEKFEVGDSTILIRSEIWNNEYGWPSYLEIAAQREEDGDYNGTDFYYSFYAEDSAKPAWHIRGGSELDCRVE